MCSARGDETSVRRESTGELPVLDQTLRTQRSTRRESTIRNQERNGDSLSGRESVGEVHTQVGHPLSHPQSSHYLWNC